MCHRRSEIVEIERSEISLVAVVFVLTPNQHKQLRKRLPTQPDIVPLPDTKAALVGTALATAQPEFFFYQRISIPTNPCAPTAYRTLIPKFCRTSALRTRRCMAR